jgi:hypothetical protein
MQRIGQDVAEKLDYQPGVFTVSAMCAASGRAGAARSWCKRRCLRTPNLSHRADRILSQGWKPVLI